MMIMIVSSLTNTARPRRVLVKASPILVLLITAALVVVVLLVTNQYQCSTCHSNRIFNDHNVVIVVQAWNNNYQYYHRYNRRQHYYRQQPQYRTNTALLSSLSSSSSSISFPIQPQYGQRLIKDSTTSNQFSFTSVVPKFSIQQSSSSSSSSISTTAIRRHAVMFSSSPSTPPSTRISYSSSYDTIDTNNSNNNNNNNRSRITSFETDNNNKDDKYYYYSSSSLLTQEFDQDDISLLLSYLPDKGQLIPPETRLYIELATERYMQGMGKYSKDESYISLAHLSATIQSEYQTRIVPIEFTDPAVVATPKTIRTSTSSSIDIRIAEILSVCSIHRIPNEITAEILQLGIRSSIINNKNNNNDDDEDYSKVQEYYTIFQQYGWDAVSFPEGLAIVEPKDNAKYGTVATMEPKLESNLMRSIFQRNQRQAEKLRMRRQHARTAIQAASRTIPPERRRLLPKHEFLRSIEEQFRSSSSLSSSSSSSYTVLPMSPINNDNNQNNNNKSDDDENDKQIKNNNGPVRMKLFFPNSVRSPSPRIKRIMERIGMVFQPIQRTIQRYYNKFKAQGRASFISYCFLNFLVYSVGMVWQWRYLSSLSSTASSTLSVGLLDPYRVLSSSSSSSSILSGPMSASSTSSTTMKLLFHCAWKFGTVFASLLAFSQVLKVPKVIFSVMLAPSMNKLLNYLQTKYQLSNVVVIASIITTLVLVWIGIVSVPIIMEYTKLLRIITLNDEIIQMYSGVIQSV